MTKTYHEMLGAYARSLLLVRLDENLWNVTNTAKSLKLTRGHVQRLMKKHQIRRKSK